MEVTRTLLAAIYIRVPTRLQFENGYGADIQRERCEGLIKSKGWKMGKVYEDLAVSGTIDGENREGMDQLLHDAENGDFDAIVFYALDRLGRTSNIVIETVTKFTNLGLIIASCRESIDTHSPTGKFALNIFASFAELEKDNMIERLTMGREFRRANIDGDTGGTLPYGYTRIKKKAHIDPTAAKNVNRIYRLSLIEGKRDSEIIRALNSENIPSPSGKKWASTSFRRILYDHRDKYMGGFREMSEFRWPNILEPDIIAKIIEEGNFEKIPSFCGPNGEYVEDKNYEDMVWYRAKTAEELKADELERKREERQNRSDRNV